MENGREKGPEYDDIMVHKYDADRRQRVEKKSLKKRGNWVIWGRQMDRTMMSCG